MQMQLATRIEAKIKKAVEKVCDLRGLKINRFVEDALVDKLEEMADLDDLRALRREPSRPLGEVLKELESRGKIFR